MLAFYATRLRAVELNATFRARPTASAIAGWVAATPPDFRFIVKAQRGAALRAMGATPEESVAWQLEPLPGFGERLGGVLFRVPEEVQRHGSESDARLARVLAAWPQGIRLVVELQHPSWQVDETFDALRSAGAVLCATELPEDPEPPIVRLTGSALYLRLRRHDYSAAEIDAWAARISPFLEAGNDVYAFFRHDDVGRGPELALALEAAIQAST